MKSLTGGYCPKCGGKVYCGNDAGSNWDDEWYVACESCEYRVENLTCEESSDLLREKEDEDA